MIDQKRKIEIRTQALEFLKKKLIGPGWSLQHGSDEKEVLTENPRHCYLSGILYKKNDTGIKPGAGSNESLDDTSDLSESLDFNAPHSMGISFCIEIEQNQKINLEIRFAKYNKEKQKNEKFYWKRQQFKYALTISLQEDLQEQTLEDEIKISCRSIKLDSQKFLVTAFLVNNSTKDIFQPEILIQSNDKYKFVPLFEDLSQSTEEERQQELLYLAKPKYATGLGVSVQWEINTEGRGKVFTTFLPTYELPTIEYIHNSLDQSETDNLFSIYSLSSLDLTPGRKKRIKTNLNSLKTAYADWISKQKSALEFVDEQFRKEGDQNIENCQRVLERINQGIEILLKNKKAQEAFTYANTAMLWQRLAMERQGNDSRFTKYHDDVAWEKELEKIDDLDPAKIETKYRWRPFQLAFLLLNIESVVNKDSIDRTLVDLLTFPTGGGKTEAYLLLIAFTIFYRRLREDRNRTAGTTVIMRYTLRLLTTQQFQRAAALICALERLRRQNEDKFGYAKITVGLWVGQSTTPNTDFQAKEAVEKLNQAQTVNEANAVGNPFALARCPWCGTHLEKKKEKDKLTGPIGYAYIEKSTHPFQFQCPQPTCEFHSPPGIPVQVVDEELYKDAPTLLFSTVDKMVMLTWKGEPGSFFSTTTEEDPPELIIQDELHLITESLGSLVGFYETLIDALCQKESFPPKIVASTATARNASEQCSQLYNRDVQCFPPFALSASDTFFYKEAEIDHSEGKFGRLYIGIMARNGKNLASNFSRILEVLLLLPLKLDLKNDEEKEYLWTVLGYFQTLKSVGQESLIFQDCGISKDRPLRIKELTGRIQGAELNSTLSQLEKTFYPKKNGVVDMALATNMISVGLDVARLNVMAVCGQPRSTNEYIQATSRVGRRSPGIVITLFNQNNVRDNSFYENFVNFHSHLYRHVEPATVTCYSNRVLERLLHAVLIGYVRHANSNINSNPAIFTKSKFCKDISAIKKFIVNRYCSIIERERKYYSLSNDKEKLEKEIDEIFNYWEIKASENTDLEYGFPAPSDSTEDFLMIPFGSQNDTEALETMTSLRGVEGEIRGEIYEGKSES